MERFFKSISIGVLLLFLAGGFLTVAGGRHVLTSLKSETTFEELVEEELKSGMHIKGDVPNTIGCFGYEETTRETSGGAHISTKISKYFYAVSVGDKVVGVEIMPDNNDGMEALLEETYEYLVNGGAEPSTKVTVEGKLTVMDEELKGLFDDYLLESGYTQEEITAMGDVYFVDFISFGNMRIMFIIGIVLLAIAILIFVIKFRKIGRMMAASNDMFENVQFQNTEYETVDYTQNNENE